MNKLMLLSLLALLCMQACKKDDPADEQPEAKPADYFFPMKVGSYWVYETVNGLNGNINVDTIIITGDSAINGRIYYRFNQIAPAIVSGGGMPYLLADSAGYVIDPAGNLYSANISAADTVEITNSNMYDMVTRIGNRDTVINVTAGSFHTLEGIADVYYTGMASPTGVNPRHMYTYSAKDIGCVKATHFYLSGPHDLITTLKSYHLEP